MGPSVPARVLTLKSPSLTAIIRRSTPRAVEPIIILVRSGLDPGTYRFDVAHDLV